MSPTDNDAARLKALLEAEDARAGALGAGAAGDDDPEHLMALAELAERPGPLEAAAERRLAADPRALELFLAGREPPKLGPLPLRIISYGRALVELGPRPVPREGGALSVLPLNIFGGLRPAAVAAAVALLVTLGFEAGRIGGEAAMMIAEVQDGALETAVAGVRLLEDPLAETYEELL